MNVDQNLLEGRRWYRQAMHDFEAAELNRRNALYDVACFLAQQSAEKALKGYLYSLGQRDMVFHSVVRLLERARPTSDRFVMLDADARTLDAHYIPARYPNGLPDMAPYEFYTEEMADRALAACKSILEAIREVKDLA